METQVKQNGQVQAANTVKADKTPKFVAGNPVNEVAKAQEEKAAEQQREEVKAGEQSPQIKQPTKLEIKAALVEQKPALNLEQTLKKIKDLSRLSNQREKLIGTIDNLDTFEVAQLDDAEETNLNHYQRCELKITDDSGNSFTTKNPFIIDQVAKNIKGLCTEKLTEVEAQISLNL